MFTSKMIHLTAVVLQQDKEKVSRTLLEHGVLDFVKISMLSSGIDKRINELDTNMASARIQEQIRRIDAFLSSLPGRETGTRTLDINGMAVPDLDKTERELDKIGNDSQDIRNRQRDIQKEILRMEDMKRQLSMFGDLRQGMNRKSSYAFLQIQAGTVPNEFASQLTEDLKAFPSVQINLKLIEGRQAMLVVSLKKDEQQISRILQRNNWTEADLPENSGVSGEKAARDLDSRLDIEKSKQRQLDGKYSGMISEKKAWLDETRDNLLMNRLVLKIQSYFSKTSRTLLFSGWLPAEKQEELGQAIQQACSGECFLEWHRAEVVLSDSGDKVEVPVRLKNPKLLKPFEMLVKNYATPAYKAIDPTPFVAVSYLLMFGLMFGDLGQGLVLVLIGALALVFKRGQSENMRSLFLLIVYCGIIASAAGVLFGSVFGMEWIKPLWFDFHQVATQGAVNHGPIRSIYGVLLITIYFGVSVIGIGLVLNWINLFRSRNWLKLIFDKGGLLGGWMYAAGVYTGFFFASNDYRLLPASAFLIVGFAIPGLLMYLKEIIHHRTEKKKFTAGFLLNSIMAWIVEMLEVFSGYLANTLSFMRVAGLGIAHASLMYAFAIIAGMAAGSGGTWSFASYLIYFAGNALVIALEGLSAGIQALRLNYYEFFSKYFNGTGKAYAPVSLRIRNQED